jgi:putative ABC transport system substrate-binding protein
MRRRAFIVGLGGAAALPMVARGQQSKVWRVGYLTPASADDEVSVGLFDVFRLKLRDLGYVEGKNLRLDLRRAEGDYTRLPTLAVELVSLAPDVIAGTSSPATAALQRATSSIPIVMTAINDPIGLGFVKSLARPGGNITGLSNLSADFTAKSFELLHVAVPNAKRVAVLTSPNPLHEAVVTEAYTIAGAMGLTIVPVMARTPADLNDAFSAMNKETCDAVVVLSDPRTSRKIVELANEWRLPAIYQATGFADMGGLLTYSANFPEMFQRAAVYVDKVLRGASPADLPVEQPTRLELQVNLKTAKALGLTIPDSILFRADRVIE